MSWSPCNSSLQMQPDKNGLPKAGIKRKMTLES